MTVEIEKPVFAEALRPRTERWRSATTEAIELWPVGRELRRVHLGIFVVSIVLLGLAAMVALVLLLVASGHASALGVPRGRVSIMRPGG